MIAAWLLGCQVVSPPQPHWVTYRIFPLVAIFPAVFTFCSTYLQGGYSHGNVDSVFIICNCIASLAFAYLIDTNSLLFYTNRVWFQLYPIQYLAPFVLGLLAVLALIRKGLTCAVLDLSFCLGPNWGPNGSDYDDASSQSIYPSQQSSSYQQSNMV